ncbi:MAG: hypothetical protein ACPG3U_00075 [Rhodothermales bacterium]
MRELDEIILGSIPLIFAMALFFGAAFATVFGLVALVMEGVFELSDQAIMAGLSATLGFLVVTLLMRQRMFDESRSED